MQLKSLDVYIMQERVDDRVLMLLIVGRTDGKHNVALAHPDHVGKSCRKFGYIPSSSLGRDSVRDGQTDRH